MLMDGDDANEVREENFPFTPIRSNPALQNAEIEWKTLYQIPRRMPNSLQNAGAMATAPKSSNITVILIMKPVSSTMPPTLSAEIESCIMLRPRIPILFPDRAEKNIAIVTIPMPPIWISVIITACPNVDQYVAVSCTTSPVTQSADVAVKSASAKLVHSPLADEIGSISMSAPRSIPAAKLIMMI